jgi:hypothetical protein
LKGLNSDNDTQALETRLFYDSSLTHRGKGCSMWFPDGSGNLKDWRLDPLETWISKNGKRAVTKLYVDREDAIAMVMLFAEDGKKEEIEALVRNADADHPEPITGVDFEEEMDLEDEVGLYFGFIEQRGGRKPWMIIAIDSETVLYSGEMPIKTQPISWMNCTAGYREGQSKPEGRGIAPYSYWLNQLQQKLYTSLQYSVPHVVAEEGQDVKPPMDAPFHVWRFAKGKNPVTVEIPKTVSADVIANMKDLQENAMQDKGLTEDTAAGAVPHGVVSGVAIGKIQNEMAIAFSEQIHNVNAYRIRSARIACYWLSSDHMKDAKIRAKATNSEDMEAISWPSLGMEENTWTVVIQTAGALPESPGGKAQMISVFQEMGLVDERDAAMAFDNPDLMKLLSRKTTPLRLIRLQISMCLEMDPPRIYAPDETQDPVLGYEETAAAYADARIKGKKKYPRAQTDALFRLHILYRNRMKNTAPAATVSAPAPTLAGGGTNTGNAGAAAGLSAGAGSMLTDPAAQAAAATTGASGTL